MKYLMTEAVCEINAAVQLRAIAGADYADR